MPSTLTLPAPNCAAEPPASVTILLAGAEPDTTALLAAVSDTEPQIIEEYADITSAPGFVTGAETISAQKGQIAIGDTVVLLFVLPAQTGAWRCWTDLLDGAAAALLVTECWPEAGTDLTALDVFEQHGIPHSIAVTGPPRHGGVQPTEQLDLLHLTEGGPTLTRIVTRPRGVDHQAFVIAAAIDAIGHSLSPLTTTVSRRHPA